jgi:hypothetical protein
MSQLYRDFPAVQVSRYGQFPYHQVCYLASRHGWRLVSASDMLSTALDATTDGVGTSELCEEVNSMMQSWGI